MFEDYGFREANVPIARCFARYLQADANVELDAYEIQVGFLLNWGKKEDWGTMLLTVDHKLRMLMIDSLARVSPNYPEIVPTLLLQVVSPHEEIRYDQISMAIYCNSRMVGRFSTKKRFQDKSD